MKYEADIYVDGGRADFINSIDMTMLSGGARVTKGWYRVVIEKLPASPLTPGSYAWQSRIEHARGAKTAWFCFPGHVKPRRVKRALLDELVVRGDAVLDESHEIDLRWRPT